MIISNKSYSSQNQAAATNLNSRPYSFTLPGSSPNAFDERAPLLEYDNTFKTMPGAWRETLENRHDPFGDNDFENIVRVADADFEIYMEDLQPSKSQGTRVSKVPVTTEFV